MAVATAGTLRRVQLVQLSELDPEWRLIGTGDSTGDGTGGRNILTFTIPTDLSALVATVACEIGQSSTSNSGYVITEGTSAVFQSGAPANLIDTVNMPHHFNPPQIMLFDHPITVQIAAVNTNLEVMTGRVIMLAWELQIGRNIPQKFFWPATMD